ncbi:MAG: branched-chain amino acid ABC transporter permease [Thermovirgaceae bacterium]|jgi:branched-chain amino acid transport system permease protein|nr:branched-chain amino acid ABC transporter permease [Synergistales bacterium]MDI9392233.1 branched-chain amino acid ABC transporter permease [Synergistota bacterium]NLV65382.1 branched-chain amino acid ABC transporter permease [Synergistaceae bacterium]HRW87778.1 branched-chain amino acid ABC transporter permease [Thermovirgaceae bacterium]MDD3134363.1 branched-chain amino acid ABC transporter permease [Synergistales bacterium]
MGGYFTTVATMIGIYALVASGLNIIVGFAGQISLGHAAFFGIGAYSTALLCTKLGLSFWWSLPLATLITGLIGALLGIPSLRVKDDFLAITTIGINFIVRSIFLYVPFFGGALGIGGIPTPTLLDTRLRGEYYLTLVLVLLALTTWFVHRFARSWTGLATEAMREEETAAGAMGISHVRFKILAFTIGSAMAGLGGVLYAHFVNFISPDDFGFPVSIMLLSMVVLGGMGKIWGPILGAIVLGSLPEVFRPLVQYRMLLYGAALLLVIRYQPQGILGEGSLLRRLFPRGRR